MTMAPVPTQWWWALLQSQGSHSPRLLTSSKPQAPLSANSADSLPQSCGTSEQTRHPQLTGKLMGSNLQRSLQPSISSTEWRIRRPCSHQEGWLGLPAKQRESPTPPTSR
uniref:Uncharacterized protein n=1 Tax=Potexvirus alternantherae TaxID=85454 RepID=C1KFW5_9VIRU|nr:unknown [Alternanthera mosaic virus]